MAKHKQKRTIKDVKKSVPRPYEVTITYKYLVKALDTSEAVGMAMNRLLGRHFTGVYFDGMITNAVVTDREGLDVEHFFDDIKQERTVEEGGESYGIKINRSRESSKEQEHIHFNPADSV